VKVSRLVSHWSNHYDAALNATVLNCSIIISKGLPEMLSPYHNTFDNCNISVSYAINSERNDVCLVQNIHKFASCLHAIFIPFLPHFKKSASNNHQKLLISWFYHGNKIFVMEFQNSLHNFLLFTNTVSMSYIKDVRIIVNSKWE
jgi:GTP cyclohydrolase I